ncbi:MAG TPA: iron-containing redox enzyme family protein [Polyangiaceae bacterium]|nr:iron-containing redox enzyme family protein [Polyangiaceae bacterium]
MTLPSNGLQFQLALAAFNRRRLTPTCANEAGLHDLDDEYAWRRREAAFVAERRAEVAARARRAPCDPDGFVRWFEALKQNGPGQGDPLFDWLAERASIADMTWFLTQEAAGEAGFDDLVAMTQVKLPVAAKLEMARNYWDEMGRGSAGGMHGPMLDALTRELGIPNGGCVVGESLALGNLMTAMAATRSLAFQSVGALGVIELTAPGRARRVNAGLKRLGVGGAARRYFALHATLDVKHSAAWNREVLHTLVMENPATATAIAEGALMRLEAGRRCFEEYRSYLFSRAA